MSMDFWPLLQTLIGAAVGGFGAFIAVRERLARVETRLDSTVQAVSSAHQRIDDILHAASMTLRK